MPFKVYPGDEGLRRASAFLAACRERDPLAGLWSVGDFHWWRDDAHDTTRNSTYQRFWEGREGALGLLVLSERYATFDWHVPPGLETRPEAQALFSEGLAWLERFELLGAPARPSFYLHNPPETFRTRAHEAGFFESGSVRVRRYRELTDRPATAASPPGFTVRSLGDADLIKGRPPLLHIAAPDFARIIGSPLYNPELHLVVVSKGDVAAECICWYDKAARTAMFEPVAVAKAFLRRGLAKDLMVEGLNRLAERDALRVKVSHDKHQRAAGRLYVSLGFGASVERELFVQR